MATTVLNVPEQGQFVRVRSRQRVVNEVKPSTLPPPATTVIVETPDKIESEGEYSTIRALGKEVASCSPVYFWPKHKGAVGDSGKVGLLHVKCAVADGEWLFLSSANLTQQAFTVNMELGMLVRGGVMPGQVKGHFERLIGTGVLVRV